jgi:hypothetical protein
MLLPAGQLCGMAGFSVRAKKIPVAGPVFRKGEITFIF